MIFAASAAYASAPDNTLPHGGAQRVTVPVSGAADFAFSPPETGTYRLTIAEPAGALSYISAKLSVLTESGPVPSGATQYIYPQMAYVGYDHRDFSMTAGREYSFRLEPSAVNNPGPVPETVELILSVQLSGKISYNLNGGDGVVAPQTKLFGEPIELVADVPPRLFHYFLGWAANPDAAEPQYAPGAGYTAEGSAVLYAVWLAPQILTRGEPSFAEVKTPGELRYFTFTPDTDDEYTFSSGGGQTVSAWLLNENNVLLAYNTSASGNFTFSAQLNGGTAYFLRCRLMPENETGGFTVAVSGGEPLDPDPTPTMPVPTPPTPTPTAPAASPTPPAPTSPTATPPETTPPAPTPPTATPPETTPPAPTPPTATPPATTPAPPTPAPPTPTPPVHARTFADVAEADWYYNAVSFCVSLGIMNGVSATEFAPGTALSRAMLVTILYNYAGAPNTASLPNPFEDVPNSSGCWYLSPVKWAAANGLVSGYDGTHFGPNDPITREQLASILFRFAQKSGLDVTTRADLSRFEDAAGISVYAGPAISWCSANGIISGMSGTEIAPQAGATRAQAASMLMKYIQNAAKE
jgi:hypothetical protein